MSTLLYIEWDFSILGIQYTGKECYTGTERMGKCQIHLLAQYLQEFNACKGMETVAFLYL